MNSCSFICWSLFYYSSDGYFPIGIHLVWDGQDLLSDACTCYGNWKSTLLLDFKDRKVWVTLIFQNSWSPATLSDVPACSLMVLYPRAHKHPICRIHKQEARSLLRLLITLEKLQVDVGKATPPNKWVSQKKSEGIAGTCLGKFSGSFLCVRVVEKLCHYCLRDCKWVHSLCSQSC